jgi:hypothetical protein
MAPPNLNLLITSFAGLGLPPTLVLPVSRDVPVSDIWSSLKDRIPQTSRLLLSTVSNKDLPPTSHEAIGAFAPTKDAEFLSLRLSAPVCGGKGGFGSQLRAAGGRMSSKKRRGQGEDNGSSRNLDGRRLRTVNEAKALAEYLSIKPEMEQREKEKRRKRWEEIVEISERKQNEIRNGRKRLDNQWVEDREEVLERTRSAVQVAMKAQRQAEVSLSTSQGSSSSSTEDGQVASSPGHEHDGSKEPTPPSEVEQAPKKEAKEKPRALFGFDEDDEFMSSDSDEE